MSRKYVRVQDELGHRYSVLEQEALANPDAYEVLDEPATHRNGDPLPAELAAPEEPTVVPPSRGPLSSLFENPEGQTATDTEES